MRRPSLTHFRGCLLGQCLGDALGFVREGFPRDDCEDYVEGLMQSWRRGEFADDDYVGQYTDDSQLARELMQSYVARRGFDPADYARRIADIFVEDRIVGRGMATHHAAMRLAAGVAWHDAGTPPPSAGNGSAMRAAPVGLMFHDPEQVARAAHDQGRITHGDPRCSAGAVAIAGAAYLAARAPAIDRSSFVTQLAQWAAPFDHDFAIKLAQLADCVDLPIDEALDQIAPLGLAPEQVGDWDRISPFVIPSVIWSLYSFLRTPDDYWQAIRTAIRVGGDVDTTAAMTGAISGAHLGLEALPAHLATRVHDRGEWNHDQLLELADRCFELATGE